MSKIYVVEGRTGEYDDRMEWIVASYKDEEKAREHAQKANQRAKELFATLEERYNSYDLEGKNEYDPQMRCDYTGTFYNYYSIELTD